MEINTIKEFTKISNFYEEYMSTLLDIKIMNDVNKIINNKYQVISNDLLWRRDKEYPLVRLISKLRKV